MYTQRTRKDATQKLYETFINYGNPVAYESEKVILLTNKKNKYFNQHFDNKIDDDNVILEKGYTLPNKYENAILLYSLPQNDFDPVVKMLMLAETPDDLLAYIDFLVNYHIKDFDINLKNNKLKKDDLVPPLVVELSLYNEKVKLDKDGNFNNKVTMSICADYLKGKILTIKK